MSNPSINSQFTLYNLDPDDTGDRPEQALVLENGNLLLLAGELPYTGADVFTRQFTVDGDAATPVVTANSTTYADQLGARAVQLKNGNILVAWTDESETAPDYDGSAVRFQLFDPKGKMIGAEATAPVGFDDDQVLEDIIPLTDGRFAVVWEDKTSWGPDHPKFRIFNADGSPAGAETLLPQGFDNSSGGHLAAAGPGGLIAVGVSPVAGDEVVSIQRYNALGNPAGELVAIYRGDDLHNAKIVRLENGDYVVTWTNSSETPPFNKGPIVQGQVISATGDKIGDTFTVSDDIFSEHSGAVVTALSDGRFAVSWHMFPVGDVLSYKEVMRVYNAEGDPESGIVTVYDADETYDGIRTGFGNLIDVSELSDGRLIYTFRAYADTNGEYIAASRIVDPRDALNVALSNAADSFTGTIYADKINGRGGNDAIEGGAGVDLLLGAGGHDSLWGGDGNDRLNGGSGNDRLFGDAGRDTLQGGAGRDILNGGAGLDRLDGGAGADRLTGGQAADTFVFTSANQARGDIITDFSARQGDVIDLSGIDANTGARADQDFNLIGSAAFSGTAGELRVWSSKGNTFVAGDMNGDGIADFKITLDGKHDLVDTDFLL